MPGAFLVAVLMMPTSVLASPVRAPAPDPRVVSYVLDADDRIVSVNVAWAAVAVENGAARLAESVVGSSLWSHIADRTTRHLYALLFRQVRATGAAVRVPYRCDAPSVVREMELQIATTRDRAAGGTLVLRSHVVAERVRAPVALLDPLAGRCDALVRMCGWCKRVALADRWVDAEAAITASRLFYHAPVPQVTHTICDACERATSALLDDEARGP